MSWQDHIWPVMPKAVVQALYISVVCFYPVYIMVVVVVVVCVCVRVCVCARARARACVCV